MRPRSQGSGAAACARRHAAGCAPKVGVVNIVIIGAGEVGTHIARFLSQARHNVVVIDRDPQRLQVIEESLDVRTLCASATDLAALSEAGTGQSDLLLAVSDSDEVNFAAALLGKRMGARRVIARARKAFYLGDRLAEYAEVFGADRIVCPEVWTAAEIARILEHPGTLGVTFFARGRIQMRRIEVEPGASAVGRPLQQVPFPRGALLASIRRGDDLIVPHGSDTVQAGDHVTIIGATGDIGRIQALFRATKEPRRRVVIAGGGLLGRTLAQILEKRQFAIRIVDRDLERCRGLSEALGRTEVLHGDATDLRFLEETGLSETDVFVGATNDDQTNIMSGLLMGRMGVATRIVIVHRPDLAPLLQDMGLTHALSPRDVMAGAVVTALQREEVTAVQLLEEGRAEVLELRVPRDAEIVGRAIKNAGLPRGVIVAAIVRRGDVFVPGGDDPFLGDDTVVAYALSESAEKFEALIGKRV